MLGLVIRALNRWLLAHIYKFKTNILEHCRDESLSDTLKRSVPLYRSILYSMIPSKAYCSSYCIVLIKVIKQFCLWLSFVNLIPD